MKFGNPILTSELSGALGGVVASSSRGGLGYFRVRRTPGNPRTPGMTIVRSILTSLAAAWVSVLSSPQRAGWAAAAGGTSSGIDAFVKGNAIGELSGEDPALTAPSSLALGLPPVTVEPVLDASAHTLTVTVPGSYTDLARVAVFASAPQRPSRAAQQFNFLFVASTADAATGAIALAIPPSHPAYNAVAGQVVYVRVVPFGFAGGVVTGQTNIGEEFRTIVVA